MWLIIPPSTASPSAAAPSVSNSDSKSPCLDTVPRAWSNGKLISRNVWRAGLKKNRWPRVYGGTISKHSTADRSATEFISSLPVFRVRATALPGSGSEQPMTDGSGITSPESSERLSQNLCSSKTSQGSSGTPLAMLREENWTSPQMSLLEASAPFSGIWPGSGSMLSGVVYELPTLDIHIRESDFSFWPTAQAHDGRRPGVREASLWATATRTDPERGDRREHQFNNTKAGEDLTTQTHDWMSPRVARGAYTRDKGNPDLERLTIEGQAQKWQTPATDSFRSRGGDRVMEMGLDQESRHWQTPQARDFRSGEILPETAAKHQGTRPLPEQVKNWPSPDGTFSVNGVDDPQKFRARAAKLKQQGKNGNGAGIPLAVSAVESEQTQFLDQGWGLLASSMTFESFTDEALAELGNAIRPNSATPSAGPNCWCGNLGCDLRSHKRRLNPLFVACLMGLPIWWLTTEPRPSGLSEMRSYHSMLVRRLSYFIGG